MPPSELMRRLSHREYLTLIQWFSDNPSLLYGFPVATASDQGPASRPVPFNEVPAKTRAAMARARLGIKPKKRAKR